MTVSEIINRVRWAVDEEKGYADYETGYMDNIIKASIHDALVWVNTYADSSLLVGTSADSGYVKHETLKVGQDGYLTPTQSLLRIIRVRNTGWNKAVMTPVREDSEEYVMQADETAKADAKRPIVAIIESVPRKLQVFPGNVGDDVEVTYAYAPSATVDDNSDIAITSGAQGALIYYLAYLLMIAYNDPRAGAMFGTAKMHAGIIDGKE